MMAFIIYFQLLFLSSAETVTATEQIENFPTIEQPTWSRNNLGVSVDQIISPARAPQPQDSLADSIVTIGFYLVDNSFLPEAARTQMPVNKYYPMCTGSVVAEKKILTAAHCREMLDIFNLSPDISNYARFVVIPTRSPNQSSHLDRKAVTFSPRNFNPNPSYTGTGDRTNDIAIITLDRPVVAPIARIIAPNQIVPNTAVMRSYGYSWMETGDSLKFNETRIPTNFENAFPDPVDQNSVRDVFRRAQIGTASEYFEVDRDPRRRALLYPSATDRHSCPGTSGGPVFAEINGQYYIAGVISGSYRDDRCENKKVNTNAAGLSDIGSRDAAFGYEETPPLSIHGAWLTRMLRAQ